jgi:hypothetical protein
MAKVTRSGRPLGKVDYLQSEASLPNGTHGLLSLWLDAVDEASGLATAAVEAAYPLAWPTYLRATSFDHLVRSGQDRGRDGASARKTGHSA